MLRHATDVIYAQPIIKYREMREVAWLLQVNLELYIMLVMIEMMCEYPRKLY